MSLTFGEKIKEARKHKNLTQKQLADLIGAAHNSISDWENNKNKPDPDTIELLCGVLKITPNYLLTSSEDDFSPSEKLIIEKYRDLDTHGKKMVDFILNEEWERSKEQSKQIQKMDMEVAEEIVPLRLWSYYGKIACAGTGFIFDDIPTDTIKAPYRDDADFIIGVNGDSMEPDYFDGEKLYIKKTESIELGEVGIFTINNECFLKEYGEHGLVSKNKKYNDIKGDEDVRFIGKVVGKVEE